MFKAVIRLRQCNRRVCAFAENALGRPAGLRRHMRAGVTADLNGSPTCQPLATRPGSPLGAPSMRIRGFSLWGSVGVKRKKRKVA